MTVEEWLGKDNRNIIKVNNILAFNHIQDSYYTDGEFLYFKIKKDKNCKNYRIRFGGKSFKITPENVFELDKFTNRNYIFFKNELYRMIQWMYDKDGYLFYPANLENKNYKISAHRLKYFYYNNIIPSNNLVIDHIDRNKQNNSLENLRLVSIKENCNNIDYDLKKASNSYYIKYHCIDLNGNVLYTGYASDMQREFGIKNNIINKYVNKNYIYNGKYKFIRAEN